MTRPTPSDAAHQALALARERADRDNARQELKHRRYQQALATTCAEVKAVLAYWRDEGHDLHAAITLTGITLNNLPEGV